MPGYTRVNTASDRDTRARVIIVTVCQDISESLDEGSRLDAIIIDFSKAFDLVLRDRLLKKIAASGVDSRVVVWIREFLLDRSQMNY